MAEPTSPDEQPTAAREPARSGSELLQPPTEEELTETGEPTAAEIHEAAGSAGGPASPAGAGTPASEPVAPAVEPAPVPVEPAAEEAAAPERTPSDVPPPPAPPAPQPVVAPADELEPLPPIARGNRVIGTAWVLLAAGLFQVVFFGINALVALSFGGASAALPQVRSIAQTSLAWLPVLLFFLLFELVVLLLNRAGRFAYVITSLVIGIVVYVATVLLYSLIVLHTVGDANTLAQTFLNWEFILVGLVAREVMLWTGIAIGSRGIRVRNRNREAQARYDRELADARD